jgi:large subunit ribosomal protein L6
MAWVVKYCVPSGSSVKDKEENMSRIGKMPIAIPAGVEVKVTGPKVSIKGPLGKLDWALEQGLGAVVEGGQLLVSRATEERNVRALHGLARAELSNMMHGVSKGYERSLEITGVGYKVALQGRTMSFNVGYINPVLFQVPAGIEVKVDKQTLINVKGVDKRLVGQVAANLRAIKPPDVYKQKGVRYMGEVLRKKEGKTGK